MADGFHKRLGVVPERKLSFRENVYPLLRRCELYMQQLPRKFEPVRTEFQRVKQQVWERFTGRKLNWGDEMQLKKQLKLPVRHDKKLELGKKLSKSIGRTLFRGQ